MVNPKIINERLREIKENLMLLEELKSIPFDKFRDDPRNIKSAERCLQISIQCILDICHHIIVDSDLMRPRDNKHVLEIIAAQKIIPGNFAKRIALRITCKSRDEPAGLIPGCCQVDPLVVRRGAPSSRRMKSAARCCRREASGNNQLLLLSKLELNFLFSNFANIGIFAK